MLFCKIQLDEQSKRVSIRSVGRIIKHLDILRVLENTRKDNVYIIDDLLDLSFLALHL